MRKIELSEKTKANVRELIRTINELQIRLQLILTTIVDEHGGDVNKYRLDDELNLIEIEESKD
jgi:FKBP-type peptidyl-prolyl cis-trans isomerase (trigger factor)